MKYLSILRYVLLIASVVVVAQGFTGAEIVVDTMLNWAYILMGITAVLSVGMPLINLAKNPAAAVRSLIGVAIVAVVLVVTYNLSDATPITTATGDVFDNELELRLSDTGLYTTYFAFGVCVLSIIVLEIYNMFK